MTLNVRCIYQIIKLLLTMIYLEHLFSSIWSFIGLIEEENGGYNWVQYKSLVGRDWKLIYLESIYYTTVTLTSVGYGDISPQSKL
jgi:voltage-gated potassium channel Kch